MSKQRVYKGIIGEKEAEVQQWKQVAARQQGQLHVMANTINTMRALLIQSVLDFGQKIEGRGAKVVVLSRAALDRIDLNKAQINMFPDHDSVFLTYVELSPNSVMMPCNCGAIQRNVECCAGCNTPKNPVTIDSSPGQCANQACELFGQPQLAANFKDVEVAPHKDDCIYMQSARTPATPPQPFNACQEHPDIVISPVAPCPACEMERIDGARECACSPGDSPEPHLKSGHLASGRCRNPHCECQEFRDRSLQ